MLPAGAYCRGLLKVYMDSPEEEKKYDGLCELKIIRSCSGQGVRLDWGVESVALMEG
jgi:hypothetical protein